MNVALELAERAVFLEKGEVRFSGRTRRPARPPRHPALGLHRRRRLGRGDRRDTRTPGRPTTTCTPARPRRSFVADPRKRIPPSAEAPSILECNGVRKSFGGIAAIQDISLTLRDGEILGLIGHNGAGKTTFFDCVSGFLPLDGGRIRLGGVDIDTWPALHARRSRASGAPSRRPGSSRRSRWPRRSRWRWSGTCSRATWWRRGCACRRRSTRRRTRRRRPSELVEHDGPRRLPGEAGRRAVHRAPGASSSWPACWPRSPASCCSDEPSGGVAQRETEAMGPLADPGAAAHRLLDPGGRARHAAAHGDLRPHDRPGARARSSPRARRPRCSSIRR